jgi:hypothetical protein
MADRQRRSELDVGLGWTELVDGRLIVGQLIAGQG